MITYTDWTVTTNPSRIVSNVPDTRGYAPHVRGRAFRFRGLSKWTWAFDVTSETGGERVRVAGDDGYRSMAEAFAACEFATAAAREAWMRGFGRRARGLQ